MPADLIIHLLQVHLMARCDSFLYACINLIILYKKININHSYSRECRRVSLCEQAVKVAAGASSLQSQPVPIQCSWPGAFIYHCAVQVCMTDKCKKYYSISCCTYQKQRLAARTFGGVRLITRKPKQCMVSR